MAGFAIVLGAPSSSVRAATQSCAAGTTLNIVAHEDDDLLFMSPSVLHDVQSNRCVVTVFTTAGDAGRDETYWKGREAGSEAAYADMTGVGDSWAESTLTVSSHTLQVRTLANVTLVFMRLPDGSHGEGYPNTGSESLQKLWQSDISAIEAIDGSGMTYTKQGLVDVLTALMNQYQPGTIRTQDYVPFGAFDHSDHYATAKFAQLAQTQYLTPHTLVGYIGYATADHPLDYPSNVTGTDLDKKENAFFVYAAHDDGACASITLCTGAYADYATWLKAEYGIPVANAGLDQTVDADTVVTLDGSASTGRNADALSYAWTQTGGPAVSLSGANTTTPSFTAPANGATLSFMLTANDGPVPSSDEVTVTIAPKADLSIAMTGSPDPVRAAETLTYTLAVSNTGPSDATNVAVIDHLPSGVEFVSDAGTGAGWSCIPGSGTVTCTRASLAAGAAAPDITLEVKAPDQPDSISNTAAVSATEADPVSANNSATDTNTVTPVSDLQITNGDGKTSVDEGLDTSYTIVVSNAGPSDASGAVFKDAAVDNLNVAGVTCSANAGAECPLLLAISAMQGAGIAIPTLPKGSSVTFIVTGKPDSGATVVNTATIAPAGSEDRDLTNNSATDTDTVNRRPTANAGSPQTVSSRAHVMLDGSASDPDSGDTLTYAWAQTGGTPVALSGNHTATPTFTAPAGHNTLTFRLTVSDGRLTSSDTVTIGVENHAPVANAGRDQSTGARASVTLDGSKSSDPDGDSLTYKWQQTGGPAVSLSGTTAAKPSFMAPAAAGSLTFKLTVSDGSLTGSDSVTIRVSGGVKPAVKTHRRPQTMLLAMKLRSAKRTVMFRFSGSGGSGKLSFQCRLDGQQFSSCRVHKNYRRLARGRHVFRVRARDASGLADLTLVTKRFKI